MPYFEAETKKAQVEAGKLYGRGKERLSQKIDKANDDENSTRAAEQAAKAFNTNRQYIYEAKKIAASKPEAADKILRGQVSFAAVAKEMKHEERKAKIEAQKPPSRQPRTPHKVGNIDVEGYLIG